MIKLKNGNTLEIAYEELLEFKLEQIEKWITVYNGQLMESDVKLFVFVDDLLYKDEAIWGPYIEGLDDETE